MTFITLHTRAGASFEVGMAPRQIVAIVNWLLEQNPDVRVGAYD